MNSSKKLSPIPVPLAQRLHDARMRWLPVLVIVAALGAIAGLWRNHVAAPSMVGQAEGDLATISSPKAGMLAGLRVARFQRVRAGDPLFTQHLDPAMAHSVKLAAATAGALLVLLIGVVRRRLRRSAPDRV